MNEQRVDLAEEFLREAVYRSRASQAVSTLLAKPSSPERGQCGLGAKAAIALDLSPRGRDLFDELFGSKRTSPTHASDALLREVAAAPATSLAATASDEALLERLHARMRAWIEAQDALDRKRNHFIKAFRNQHGFDRTKYTAAETTELDAGLARINDEENRERRSAALALLKD